MIRRKLAFAAFIAVFLAPEPALAASLDGAAMPWPWALPFAAMLLSIATGPLLFPRFWHHHYGKIAFAWSVLALAAITAFYGIPSAAEPCNRALIAARSLNERSDGFFALMSG